MYETTSLERVGGIGPDRSKFGNEWSLKANDMRNYT